MAQNSFVKNNICIFCKQPINNLHKYFCDYTAGSKIRCVHATEPSFNLLVPKNEFNCDNNFYRTIIVDNTIYYLYETFYISFDNIYYISVIDTEYRGKYYNINTFDLFNGQESIVDCYELLKSLVLFS